MKLSASPPAQLGDLKVEYEKFFSVSLDMLCISSYDGHFKKVNPAFEQALGFSAEELCSKSYMEFIHPDDVEPTIKEVEKQLKTKQHVLGFENRYRCKDGSYKWLSWKSAPVGEFMYAAARDITEVREAHEKLRKAKEALESANRELEAFSYSVAHDLRSPLRAIDGFSKILLTDYESKLGEDGRHCLQRIRNGTQKMSILIDDILSLSRINRRVLTCVPVDLGEQARKIFLEIQTREVQKNSDVKIPEFKVSGRVEGVGDVHLLAILLENLLGNAWKFTSKELHPQIEVGWEKIGEKAFYVKDNGVGFDMSYAERLFSPFQRLHSETDYEGTGIGLATVHRIVSRHGGRIWPKSSVGNGATFYFTLGVENGR